MYELRDYQSLMLNAIRHSMAEGYTGIYGVLPTGCGKTRVASELVRYALPKRSIWLVHTRELVQQAADALRENLRDASVQLGPITRRPTVGVVMADSDECESDVIVASVQTVRNPARFNRLGRLGLCVIDECHHITGDNSYAAIVATLQAQSPLPIVGITATPFRSDAKAMQEILPHCAFERTIADMIRDGWLCDLVYEHVGVGSLDLSDVKMVRKLGELDYSERELVTKVEAPNVVIETVEKTAQRIKDRNAPALAFCTSVNHAHMLARAYNLAGLRAAAVYGAQPKEDRAEILSKWRNGAIDIVTNCAVLTEGFDFPQIGTLVIARPTTSVGLYTQMVGRGTRISGDKQDCLILDITGRMPARAVAITLDDLIGEDLSETTEDGAAVIKRDLLKSARPRVHALRDPFGRARFAWTQHPTVSNVWFAPLNAGIHAALLPEPTGSGLYRPFLAFREQAGLQAAGSEYVTRRQAIADMEASLARARITSKALSLSNRKWRNELPSSKQIDMLRRFDRNMAQLAISERWSKGDLSLAIDSYIIRTKIVNQMHKEKRGL